MPPGRPAGRRAGRLADLLAHHEAWLAGERIPLELYAIAIVISLFAGGLVWVAVIGALLVGFVNMQLGGYRRRT